MGNTKLFFSTSWVRLSWHTGQYVFLNNMQMLFSCNANMSWARKDRMCGRKAGSTGSNLSVKHGVNVPAQLDVGGIFVFCKVRFDRPALQSAVLQNLGLVITFTVNFPVFVMLYILHKRNLPLIVTPPSRLDTWFPVWSSAGTGIALNSNQEWCWLSISCNYF